MSLFYDKAFPFSPGVHPGKLHYEMSADGFPMGLIELVAEHTRDKGEPAIITFGTDLTQPMKASKPVSVGVSGGFRWVGVAAADVVSGNVGQFIISGVGVPAMVDGTVDVTAGDSLRIKEGARAFVKDVQEAAGQILPTTAAVALETFTTNARALKKITLLGQAVRIARTPD